MLRNLTIDANILIDGPDNEYHTHFGPAPNNAYLIGTTGIVRFKEGWLDRNGSSIHNDLDDFFKNDTVTKPRDFGTASYQFITSDTVNVQAGSQAEFDGIFTNTTHSDAIIKIQRVINDVPEGWSSAICTDVCFGTQVDSAVLRVPADSSASLKLYINVPSESGEANVQLRFTNINVPSDPVFVDFYSRALPRESVSASNTSFQMATISPNPVNEQFRINFVGTYSSIRIVDILGKTIKILP